MVVYTFGMWISDYIIYFNQLYQNYIKKIKRDLKIFNNLKLFIYYY